MGRWTPMIVLGLAACTPSSLRTVPRIVEGAVEHGAFVSPYAYEWFIEGETSANRGRHDEAAIAFENATAAPAQDALLLTRLAEEYELSGDSRRADRTLAAARRSHPDSPWVSLAQGRIAQHRNEERAAIRSFIRVQEMAPGWDAPVLAMAETLVASGRPERASALLLEYLGSSHHPGSERARRVLLDLASSRGDAETLSRAIALDPHSTPAARAREAGKLALENGQPAFAARTLASALDLPENVALWLHALFTSGEQTEVASFLSDSDGRRLGDWSERVDLLLKVGDVERALDLLSSIPPSPKVSYARGRAFLIDGNYAAAAAAFAEVPFGSASFEAARLALATCSMAQGRPGAAAEALSQAPYDSLAVRRTLAGIYLQEGALRSGLRLFDPRRDLERAALAALFERAGHFEEAAAYYAAITANGLEAPGLDARVRAERLASLGHLRAAITVLDRWTVAAPDDLYARVRLVELLAADAQLEAAQEHGQRALAVIDEPQLRAHLIAVLGDNAGAE